MSNLKMRQIRECKEFKVGEEIKVIKVWNDYSWYFVEEIDVKVKKVNKLTLNVEDGFGNSFLVKKIDIKGFLESVK